MVRKGLKNLHRLIEEATSDVPIETSFLADLKYAIEKANARSQRTPSQSYKPSSMQCIRNMYFQVTGTPPDPSTTSAELVGILESGTFRHEKLQEVIIEMKDMGIDCEYIDVETYIKQRKIKNLKVVHKQGYETKLKHTKLNISFLCDGIIKYKGKYFILEIKTETVYKFQNREGVDPAHYDQATTYSTCLGIDLVMFVYENRDTCGKKVYLFEVTDEMKMERVISKIEECDTYVKDNIPPPIPADITKKICQYCNYKSTCRKVGK